MTSSVLTPDAKLDRAKRKIAEAITDAVEAIIERGVAASEWIDQGTSPLGKRAHLALARSGKVESRKVHRRVLIRRTDLNRYIEQQAERRGENRHDDEDVSEVLERVLWSAGR